jgi:hypothetical protein
MPFTGAVSRQGTFHRSTAGNLSFSGEGSTFAVELVEGVLSFGGSLLRKLTAHRSVAGSLSADATVSRVGTFHRSEAGSLDFEGSGLDSVSHGFFEAVAGVLSGWAGSVASVLNPVAPVAVSALRIIGSGFRRFIH